MWTLHENKMHHEICRKHAFVSSDNERKQSYNKIGLRPTPHRISVFIEMIFNTKWWRSYFSIHFVIVFPPVQWAWLSCWTGRMPTSGTSLHPPGLTEQKMLCHSQRHKHKTVFLSCWATGWCLHLTNETSSFFSHHLVFLPVSSENQ